jgi:iron complex outermembrane receptor protein
LQLSAISPDDYQGTGEDVMTTMGASVGTRRQTKWLARLMISTALTMVSVTGYGQESTPSQPSAAPAGESRNFKIAPQSLADGLAQFGRQSGWQVSVPSDLIQGVSTQGVTGNMATEQALARLLTGTGFTYILNAGNTVTLRKLNPGEAEIQLPALQVIGSSEDDDPYGPGTGYIARRSVVGTKSDTPLIETPQAISVVTRQQMDDQNTQTVAQALRYTSGIQAEQRGVNTDSLEYLYSRGFQIEEYQNGLRLPSAFAGYNITSVDGYLLDRIEVLHGPASVLYGQASPGGILNLDIKRPTEEPIHEVMLQTGNYDRAQGAFDLSGPLDDRKNLLGRIVFDGFTTQTQTQYIEEKRIAVAPSLTWRPDDDTSITLFGNYQYDPDAGMYNFVPAKGTVLSGENISRNFNAGDPSFDDYSKKEMSIGYSFDHDFNDNWKIQQDFRYLYNSQSIHTLEPDGGVTADGTELIRSAYHNQGTVNMATLDTHTQGKIDTGPLKHTLTFGVDWQHTIFDHALWYGSAPNLNIADPQYHQSIPDPSLMLGTSTNQKLNQVGLYAQDQIRLDHWAFLAGLREDFARLNSRSLKTDARTQQTDTAFTWRTGLVYLFDNGISPYASYSTSFQPTSGTSYSGSAFKPTTGQQYEVGVKYQPPGSNSFVTASLFNLTQQNVLTTDPDHTNYQVQTGEVRSRGVELEAHVDVTDNLKVIANYTYTDLENTKSNSINLHKTPVAIPNQMASGWVTYDMPESWIDGLQLGAGVRFIGRSYGDAGNTFKVPSYTLLDMAVNYDIGKAIPKAKGLTATVSASNLLDKDYISSCTSAVGCTYGAGRLVLANLKYSW